MKFEVGDKVRIAEHAPADMNPGELGTVTWAGKGTYPYRVDAETNTYIGFDGNAGGLYEEDELEAI